MQSTWQTLALLSTLCMAGTGPLSGQQEQDPFSGRFRHTEFEIELTPTQGAYEGWIMLRARGERLAVHARVVDGKMDGYFIIDGGRFTFTAEPDDRGLTFMMPLARTQSDARRSFGQWVKQRCRARRIDPGV